MQKFIAILLLMVSVYSQDCNKYNWEDYYDSNNMEGCDLTGANLAGVKLDMASLRYVKSGNIVGVPASLPQRWKLVNGYLVGPAANLAGAELTGAKLAKSYLVGINLNGANLRWADLSGANVKWGDLSNADLTGTNLKRADLKQATLRYVNLEGADLEEAILSGAILTNAKLEEANFARADLYWIHLTDSDFQKSHLAEVISGNIEGVPASLPDGWAILYGTLINEQWGNSTPLLDEPLKEIAVSMIPSDILDFKSIDKNSDGCIDKDEFSGFIP